MVKSMLWEEMEIEVAEYVECGKKALDTCLWKYNSSPKALNSLALVDW